MIMNSADDWDLLRQGYMRSVRTAHTDEGARAAEVPSTVTLHNVRAVPNAVDAASRAQRGAPATRAAGPLVTRWGSNAMARWYAVTRAPEHLAGQRGLHYAPWIEVAQRLQLRSGMLQGSHCHARGFDTEEAAVAYWASEGWSLPAPLL